METAIDNRGWINRIDDFHQLNLNIPTPGSDIQYYFSLSLGAHRAQKSPRFFQRYLNFDFGSMELYTYLSCQQSISVTDFFNLLIC